MIAFCRYSLVLIILLNAISASRADFISNTLGTAGPSNFGLLALSGAQDIALNGPGTTNGTVGISSGTLSLNASSGLPAINGNVLLASGATINGNVAQQVTGNVFTNQNLTQPNIDARNAATTFASLTPTQSVAGGAVNGTTTINGTAGVNVVNLSGINLGNGQTLTLNGPAGSQFVINSPNMVMNSGKIALTGGVTANDVVFNLSGTGNNLQTSGGLNNQSVINGTVLDANGSVAMAPGLINGELIAGGQSIHLVSGASINSPPTPSVPEPASALLMVLGGLGMAALARRNSRRKELTEVAVAGAPSSVS
jgi:hypothetical protein